MLYPETIEDDISLSSLNVDQEELRFIKDHKSFLDSMISKFKKTLYSRGIISVSGGNHLFIKIVNDLKFSASIGTICGLAILCLSVIAVNEIPALKVYNLIDNFKWSAFVFLISTLICFSVLRLMKKSFGAIVDDKSLLKNACGDLNDGGNAYDRWKESRENILDESEILKHGCTENAIKKYLLHRLNEENDPGINVKVIPFYDEMFTGVNHSTQSRRLWYVDVTLSVNK